MSKRKREREKAKQRRHQKKQAGGGSRVSGILSFPAASPHLADMPPAWRQFYAAVSKAVSE